MTADALGLLGFDPNALQALQGLVGQLGPTDEDKRAAKQQALMLAGLGMIGARKGYLAQDLSRSAQQGLLNYNQDLRDLGQQRMQAIGQAAALYPMLQRTGMNDMFNMGGQTPAPTGYGMNDRSMGETPPPQYAGASPVVQTMRQSGMTDAEIDLVRKSKDPMAAGLAALEKYRQPHYGNNGIPQFRGPNNTMVSVAPEGYAQNVAGVTAANTLAQKGAEATLDLVPYTVGNQTIQVTKAEALALSQATPQQRDQFIAQRYGIGQPQLVSVTNPAPSPALPQLGGTPSTIGSYAGMSQSNPQVPATIQANNDAARRAVLNKELQDATAAGNQQNIAALNSEIARLPKLSSGAGGSAPTGMGGAGITPSPLAVRASEKAQDIASAGQSALNTDWITNSYRPALDQAKTARQSNATLMSFDRLPIQQKTGWGTDAMAKGAQILSGLGIAGPELKQLASNAELFNQAVFTKNWELLQQQKGVQTEGDSQRALKVFAQLGNRPESNQFISDFAKATNNLLIKQADFYNAHLSEAKRSGDYSAIEQAWQQQQPSVWDDPHLQKWKESGERASSAQQYVETRTTRDGRVLGKRADGSIEVISGPR